MQITEFNRLEWSRMAEAIGANGYTHLAEKLFFAAKQDSLELKEYDYLMGMYREWLVFNKLPAK